EAQGKARGAAEGDGGGEGVGEEGPRVPEEVAVGPSPVLPGVAPGDGGEAERAGSPAHALGLGRRLGERRPPVPGPELPESEVAGTEVVDAGGELGDRARDDVNLDLVERARRGCGP